MRHRRYIVMILFAASNWPSDWGWNADEMCSLMPDSVKSSIQNLLMNMGSRSLTMDSDMPWS
jgi:ABC-type transport system involved in cytochrome c biogenesis permease subunit